MTGNMKWFRFYAEVLHDPKVQKLPPQTFKHWVNILCLAAQHEGKIPNNHDDLAFALRISVDEALSVVNDLIERGLIEVTESSVSPHNWDSRQYKSDVSTDRVKRFRNGKRNVSETVSETFHDRFMKQDHAVSETPPDTDTEQIQTQSRNRAETEQSAAATAAPVDSLISEIAKEMRSKHRKTTGLGGLELERELCTLSGDAIDPVTVLRAIRERWRLGCEREWSRSDTMYWPNLLDWLRRRRYLDPVPPEPITTLDRPRKSALEALIDSV